VKAALARQSSERDAHLAARTSPTLFVGTVLAGVGVGLAFMGAFRMITAEAAPGERAGLVAATFVMAHLAFSVPALIAGVATTNFGLQVTALVYCAALAASIVAAAGILLLPPPRRSDRVQRRGYVLDACGSSHA
jgi:MFS family permease